MEDKSMSGTITLKELITLQQNGVMKIKYDKDGVEPKDLKTAVLGGVEINRDQAEKLVRKFGWTETELTPFEIIKKTDNLISNIRKSAIGKEFTDKQLESTTVELQNKKSVTYDKTFDRFVFYMKKSDRYTVIHGMEHAGAPYTVYENGNAIPFAKCRTLAKAAESLVGRVNN